MARAFFSLLKSFYLLVIIQWEEKLINDNWIICTQDGLLWWKIHTCKKQAIIFKNKRVKNSVLFYKPYEMLS